MNHILRHVFVPAIVLLALAQSSCGGGGGDEPKPVTPTNPTTPTTPTEEQVVKVSSPTSSDAGYTVDSSGNITVDGKEREVEIVLEATKSWSATVNSKSSQDWITVSTKSGYSGTTRVKISVTENYEDERTADIVFTAGTSSTTIVFTQQEEHAILSAAPAQVPADAKNTRPMVFYVRKKVSNISFDDYGAKWMVYQESMSSDTKIVIGCKPNSSTESREGDITFTSGSAKETVHISQDGGSWVKSLRTDSIAHFSPNGSEFSLYFCHSVGYVVNIGDESWVSVKNEADITDGGIVKNARVDFKVANNETGWDERKTNVRISDPTGADYFEITVMQDANQQMQIDQNKFEVSAAGGSFTVNVKSNHGFSVGAYGFVEGIYTTVPWVTLKSSYPSDDAFYTTTTYALTFSVAANDTDAKRTAQIIINPFNTDAQKTVKVTQPAGN